MLAIFGLGAADGAGGAIFFVVFDDIVGEPVAGTGGLEETMSLDESGRIESEGG